MVALTHPTRDDPDDALMPVLLVDADRHVVANLAVQHAGRFVDHAGFDVAALTVDPVQPLGKGPGRAVVVRQEALNANGHILEPAGGVESWTDGEAKILGAQGARRTSGRCVTSV